MNTGYVLFQFIITTALRGWYNYLFSLFFFPEKWDNCDLESLSNLSKVKELVRCEAGISS